jgi:hypothetical protein
MENIVSEPVALIDADLDQVAGGFLNTATAENVAAIVQEQAAGNVGGGNFANVNVALAAIHQVAIAVAL